MKIYKNYKGYTLLELMMYMLVAIMVIGFAFQMISRTQKQYGQQRSMSIMQGEGRNSIYIISADIQNCGFKNFLQETGSGTNIYVLTRIAGITTNEDDVTTPEASPGDGDASFYAKDGGTGAFDTLEFFKGSIDSDGDFEKVVRITYVVESNNLIRYEKKATQTTPSTIDWSVAPTDIDTATIVENVEALQFEFSTDKVNWVDDPTGIKSQIKAIRVNILIRTNRTVAQPAVSNTYKVTRIGNDLEAGTEVTVDGNHLRRLYTETIEVVNNGL